MRSQSCESFTTSCLYQSRRPVLTSRTTPSRSRNAPTQPEIAFSLPAGPISTRSSNISGAIVKVSPCFESAEFIAQINAPVVAFNATFLSANQGAMPILPIHRRMLGADSY